MKATPVPGGVMTLSRYMLDQARVNTDYQVRHGVAAWLAAATYMLRFCFYLYFACGLWLEVVFFLWDHAYLPSRIVHDEQSVRAAATSTGAYIHTRTYYFERKYKYILYTNIKYKRSLKSRLE